jgi:hypothetical protein
VVAGDIEMCEKSEALEREEQNAIRRLERAIGMKDGFQPNPHAMTAAEEARKSELQSRIDEAQRERAEAREEVEKHKKEHGCG